MMTLVLFTLVTLFTGIQGSENGVLACYFRRLICSTLVAKIIDAELPI